MNDERQPKADGRKRKASQKRQRQKSVNVGLTEEERRAVEEKAGCAGLSLSAFARHCLLGDPGPRAQRQPPINRQLLAQTIAELNKVGSNINQIAKALNSGHRVSLSAIEKATEELSVTLSAVIEATGKG